jgi:hypothetical protein
MTPKSDIAFSSALGTYLSPMRLALLPGLGHGILTLLLTLNRLVVDPKSLRRRYAAHTSVSPVCALAYSAYASPEMRHLLSFHAWLVNP